MHRPGRPPRGRERQISSIVLNLVTDESPGVTFTELVKAASERKIPRPTLWRHLKRLEESSPPLVLHDGKFYRRNPLYGLARIPGIDVERLRGLTADYWDPVATFGIYYTDREAGILAISHGPAKDAERHGLKDIVEVPEHFQDFLTKSTFSIMMSSYLDLLSAIRHAPSLAAARDLSNLVGDFIQGQVLALLARHVWDHRNTDPLEALDGKQLALAITWHRTPEETG